MNIHEQFIEYGRKSLEYRRKCEMLLPEIFRERIWEKNGFGSIYEYAGKLAGMSVSVVDDCLKIHRKIVDKPALLRVAEKKGLRAVKPVAYIATNKTAGFWANKASEMSNNTLVKYVKEFRNELKPKVEVEVIMILKPEVLRQLEKIRGDGNWNDLMERFLSQMTQESVKASSRHIPNEIQRFVKGKFAGLCHYPNCSLAGEVLHHTQRFGLEKVHDPARLVYLCKAHEQIAHLGLFDNEEESPHSWRLRTEPDRNHFKYFIDQKVKIYRT